MKRTLTALAVPLALALSACSGGSSGGSTASGNASSGGADAGFPVSIQNCGRTVTVDKAPQQIVSLNQGTTEMLLSLGLADRIAGTATWTDPVLPSLAQENEKVERLADNYPSLEQVLAKKPDLVTASFVNTLAEGGVAPYDTFAKLKVPAYLSHVECQKSKGGTGTSDGARETPVTMEDIDQDVRDLAALTGTKAKGEELVTSLDKRWNATKRTPKGSRPTVVFWFANAESPYVAGGLGAPGLIAEQVGLDNVYADIKDEWPQFGWEAVAAKDPDVLVIGDLTRKSETAEDAATKIAFLESNPVTKQMKAVKEKRYITLPGGDMNPSIRTVDGAEKVAEGLDKLGLGS